MHSDPKIESLRRDEIARWAESSVEERAGEDQGSGDPVSQNRLSEESGREISPNDAEAQRPRSLLLTRVDPAALSRQHAESERESGSSQGHEVASQSEEWNKPPDGVVLRESQRRSHREQRSDPLTQSLLLLATLSVMLLAARFVVPRVVEEIRYAWHRGELRAEYEAGTEGLRNVSLDALSEAYQMVTSAVGPSVVHIEVKRSEMEDSPGLLSSHFLPATDQGSGVVVDESGYIVTNRHVITEGDEIRVTLSDGRRVPAAVVGTDALTDLAVLKITANRLMPISWGDSDRCKVGTPVWAVGSPFGLDRSVTFGILSGKHRKVQASTSYQDFMQSDVAVNPGNSGGPLVDARGQLVGINTAIVGDAYQGVSFSIPSNVARAVYERLKETGRVERGWLGVSLAEVSDEQLHGDNPRIRGALVSQLVDANSPAAVAGLRAGDMILTVDDVNIRDRGHLMRIIGDTVSGTIVRLGVLREQQMTQIAVTLGSRPPELSLQ